MTVKASQKNNTQKENHKNKLDNFSNKSISNKQYRCKCYYHLDNLYLIYYKHMELCPIICIHE